MANTIQIQVLGDTRDFQKAMGKVNNDLSRLGKISNGARGILAKTFKVAGAGAIAAAAGIAVFGKQSVDAATDLNETISKTETIFGKSSKQVLNWGDNAAKALGLSKQEALDGVSTFGNFFNQIGIGTQQTERMSKGLVQAAVDLGSFHNAAAPEVMEALSAATRGEYDSLQKYIPTINAAAVEQEALAKTGKKAASELTNQEKALATYSLVMKGQGKAAGDFARTSDSVANKQKILAAQFENVKAKIGTALLPVMSKLLDAVGKNLLPLLEDFAAWFQAEGPKAIDGAVKKFNEFLPTLKKIGSFVKDNWKVLTALVAAFYAVTTVLAVIQPLITAAVGIWKAYKAIVTAVKVAQVAFNIVLMANPIGLVIAAIVALVAVFVIAYKKSTTFRKIIDKTWAAIKKATSVVWKAVAGIIKTVFKVISTVIKTYIKVYVTILKTAWKVIKAVTKAAWNFVKDKIVTPIKAGLALVRNILGNIRSAITNAWSVVKSKTSEAWSRVREIIADKISAFMDKVRGIKDRVLGAFSNAANWLYSVGKDIIRGLVNGVGDMAGALADKVSGVVGGAISKAKNLLGISSPSKVFAEFGKYVGEGLIVGMDKMRGKTAQASGNLAKGVADGFSAPSLALNGKGNGTGAGTTVNVTVNVPETANPVETGRAVAKALDAFYKSGGRRLAI